MTQYSGINRKPPYSDPSPPEGAEIYLADRAKHYDYPTEVYVGSCHCQAVTFAVLSKPITEVLVIDCSCSLCLGVNLRRTRIPHGFELTCV